MSQTRVELLRQDTNFGDIDVDSINNQNYPTSGPLSNRNLLYNGAATVYQRGEQTSLASGTTNFATDRWALQIDQAGTWTFSQSTDAPSGFGFSHKIDCTASRVSLAANSELMFQQRLEGQDLQNLDKGTANAKELTLSFYVKSAKTGTYIVEFQDANNGRNCQRAYTINTANTWEYKTLTVPGDTTGTLTNNNGHSFTIRYWLAAGSNFTSGSLQTDWGGTVNADRAVGQVNLADSTSNDWFITGVQLEVGSKATPFEHQSYGQTLAKCQRYYFRSDLGSTAGVNGFFGMPIVTATSICIGSATFPVTMRQAPDVELPFGYDQSGVVSGGTATAGVIGVNGFIRINKPSGSFSTNGTPVSALFTASAEL
jgi:hypothetical protein